ncbi:alpha/beta fold hydrolase [Cupriavidus sp. UGS-1]|uniref:alpha/beta fold hydrolase n=1 Tax=Cupriavidus sp. UGS-1 TaxID=2899826 RepID=UPI001E3EA65E|nr:alpha/beta fold hydrolase [Cupriavidus sp. UGS-1]MCD9121175.1 alpha/beta hydrolase [Cupriavidus sp. UGS-1]
MPDTAQRQRLPGGSADRVFRLRTADMHSLHVRLHGRADGVPWLVLHGGPGSGCSPSMADWFDPTRHLAILADQRGAGRSRPAGTLRRNTTGALLADIERLRAALGVERWHVAAGSWGAALALAYAARWPQRVAGLVLRGTFLTGRDDILRLFAARARGMSVPPPLRTAVAAPQARGNGADAQRRCAVRLLQNGTGVQQRDTARRWRAVETALLGGRAARHRRGRPAMREDEVLRRKYRIQAHYLQRRCGLGKPALLRCAASIARHRIPAILLHGARDRVCRPGNSARLLAAMPHAVLHVLPRAGHLATGPMAEALRAAIRELSS